VRLAGGRANAGPRVLLQGLALRHRISILRPGDFGLFYVDVL